MPGSRSAWDPAFKRSQTRVFSAGETRDYHDCVEWAGTQPWSDGNVGLSGVSYFRWSATRSSRSPPRSKAGASPRGSGAVRGLRPTCS
ncbi:CocE/NonD family hydrolase [Microbispora sp. NPDC004025]